VASPCQPERWQNSCKIVHYVKCFSSKYEIHKCEYVPASSHSRTCEYAIPSFGWISRVPTLDSRVAANAKFRRTLSNTMQNKLTTLWRRHRDRRNGPIWGGLIVTWDRRRRHICRRPKIGLKDVDRDASSRMTSVCFALLSSMPVSVFSSLLSDSLAYQLINWYFSSINHSYHAYCMRVHARNNRTEQNRFYLPNELTNNKEKKKI